MPAQGAQIHRTCATPPDKTSGARSRFSPSFQGEQPHPIFVSHQHGRPHDFTEQYKPRNTCALLSATAACCKPTFRLGPTQPTNGVQLNLQNQGEKELCCTRPDILSPEPTEGYPQPQLLSRRYMMNNVSKLTRLWCVSCGIRRQLN